MVFLVLGPLLAGAAGKWVRAGNAAVRHEQRSWHLVRADLLQPVPGPMMTDDGLNSWLVWAPARWTAGGKRIPARSPPPPGPTLGSIVHASWHSRPGACRPPATAAQVGERASVAALTAMPFSPSCSRAWPCSPGRLLDRRQAGGLGDGLAVGRPAVDPPALVRGPARPVKVASLRLPLGLRRTRLNGALRTWGDNDSQQRYW